MKIKALERKKCLAAIRNLLLIAMIKSIIGIALIITGFALLWHYWYPQPILGSSMFDLFGLIIFGLITTVIFTIVRTINDIRSYHDKSDEYLRLFYVELVRSGLISPPK